MRLREQEVKVRKLTDGRVQLDYHNPATGKRARPIFKNATIGNQERRRIEKAMEEGRDPKRMGMRFRDLAREYITQYNGKRPDTIEGNLRRSVVPYWGNWRLDAITHDDVVAWVKTLDTNGRSPYTTEAIFYAFSGAMSYACRRQYIVTKPFERVKLPRRRARTVPPQAIARAKRVVAALPRRYRALGTLSIAVGGRPAEMLALTVHDIRADTCQVVIDKQIDRGGYMIPATFKPPKDEDPRTVDVSPRVIELVVTHIAECGIKEGLLFTDEDGWPLGYQRWNRIWHEACDDAEGGKLRLHDLRHLSASLIYEETQDLLAISMRLGHTSTKTTELYVHQTAERDERSATALDRALF